MARTTGGLEGDRPSVRGSAVTSGIPSASRSNNEVGTVELAYRYFEARVSVAYGVRVGNLRPR